ncbi:hypothetical protein CEF21_16915 [Bacillus sp. FJAT-42376]|nr:hypothetical protein CEF21_16915 [Bacillus sp. FJAT-42376]
MPLSKDGGRIGKQKKKPFIRSFFADRDADFHAAERKALVYAKSVIIKMDAAILQFSHRYA